MTDIARSAIVLAVTGGIACGKSEVGHIMGFMGFKICDADHMAHDVMANGMPVYQKVVQSFGKEILAEDGEISRSALGKMVFEHPEKRLVLNQLVHPAVQKALEQWIAERRALHENAAAQIPLLFETGMETLDWDAVVCVSSTESLILERLEHRGLDRDAALKRLRAQMPLHEKEHLSDCVVQNLGTLQELEKATRAAVKSLSVER